MEPELIAESGRFQQFSLQENYPLRLADAKGCRVRCVAGIVWITAYNEPEDFELRPGELFVVPNDGLTLVEAIGRCQVEIDLSCVAPQPMYRMLLVHGIAKLLRRLTGLPGAVRTPHPARSGQ